MKNTNENEIWRNVSELGVITDGQGKEIDMSVYTNYEISNYGRVKSLNYSRTGKSKIMEGIPNKFGYYQVSLSYKGNGKIFKIHRLVCLMYKENPNNLPQINHISEDKSDNSVFNLEYCTAKENCNHGTRNERILETLKTSEKWKKSIKLIHKKESKQVFQYTKNLELIKIWESTQEAGRNGFSQGHIGACCRGERKTHKEFIWSYTPLRKTAVRMGYFGAFSIDGWRIKKGA